MSETGRAVPSVTIGITNYNYARFLPDAIESALGQTYPDVQVLVVDDGSTDGSREVIDAYRDRVTAVLQENAGQGGAFNAVWARATGDVVFFLDADDVLRPDVAERVAAEFRRQPGLAKVQFRLQLVDANRAPLGTTPDPGVLADGDLRAHVLRFRNYAWPPSSANAYARHALEHVMPIPAEEYRRQPDTYLAETVVLCGPIRSLDAIGIEYRIHGANDFIATPLSAGFLQGKIRRTIANHGHVRRLAGRLGLEGLDPDPTRLLDVAFIGFRLASLKLDPGGHPLPGDRSWRLGLEGIRAALRHPHLGAAEKAKRVVWFGAVAPAPRPLARRLLDVYLPDGPRRRRAERGLSRGAPASR